MKYILLLIALASTLCFNLRSTKQNYDAYVMAVQWPNGFCSASNCNGRDSVVDRNAMTIHGLWPSLKNGNRLNECTSGKKIIDNSSSLFQSMRKNWPSLTSTKNVDFWGHEYNKHGYCMVEEYGWSGYERYFQFVIDLHNRSYKNIIKNAFPSYSATSVKVTYDKMKEALRRVMPNATINMKCSSGYISELYFYLDKNYSPCPSCKFSNQCGSGTLVFK